MPSRNLPLPVFGLAGVSLFLLGAVVVPADPTQKKAAKTTPDDGAKIFKDQCAPCHGAKGEGGPGFSKPLAGTKSAAELAKFIAASMPPGPKKCPAPEAAKVAQFIYDAFYSPVAQERIRPPRLALTRLTVRQFQNAVADLVGGFRPAVPSAPSGLHAQYYKSRNFDGAAKVIDRVDAGVKFDFGTDGPEPGKFEPHNFSVLWQGSVYAPDTGDYEFVVQSDHAIRLWVNGWKAPLIDGWVRATADKEFRATIHLLGGRAYPIQLDFSKATTGVDDSDKKKGKPAPPASIALLWRRPDHTEEVIPGRDLYPTMVGPTFVTTTHFPPDDRSTGYERGNSISKEWDDATTAAAIETADYLADRLESVTGIHDDDKERPKKLRDYARGFVQHAFGHPLAPETAKTYIDKQFDSVADPVTALKRTIILTLKSPRFLYREVSADPYAVATNLSYGLWDSLPDPTLIQAAEKGALATPEQVSQQAERMANDPRAWNKLRGFLLQWLKVDEVPDIVKNPKKYPDFDAAAVSDLRTSLELFLENTAWSKDSDYRQLMLSQTEYLNGRLAKLYGANLPADAPFQAVALDQGQRAGVITQPYLLSRFAYLDNSSPIHRGVLIVRNLLGRTLNPPPSAFAPLAASLHPDLTTRERVSLQTKPAMCTACHGIINPLGFTLERFDAIGKLRDVENGKKVDATGSYLARSGQKVSFSDATDLAKYLADSDDAHSAFVEKLFLNMVKQPANAYDPKTLPELGTSFAKSQYSIRSLMVQIMVATAMPKGNHP